jgi:hypothetical protein
MVVAMNASSRLRRVASRALVAVVVSAAAVGGLATSASADPGNGNGNANGPVNGAEHASENSKLHQTEGTGATVGDPTQPQPPSNADENGTGANTNGPYDSTRDGKGSENGEGGGQANGKPCAGCVGKADNKNPPGQQPGPEDHNKGYECDLNKGIAKTNPAHTGCVDPGTPPECDPEVEDCTPPPECDPEVEDCTPVCNPDIEICDETTPPPDEVLGEVIVRDPVVQGVTLARTGADIGALLTSSGLLLSAGGHSLALGRRARRRRPHSRV